MPANQSAGISHTPETIFLVFSFFCSHHYTRKLALLVSSPLSSDETQQHHRHREDEHEHTGQGVSSTVETPRPQNVLYIPPNGYISWISLKASHTRYCHPEKPSSMDHDQAVGNEAPYGRGPRTDTTRWEKLMAAGPPLYHYYYTPLPKQNTPCCSRDTRGYIQQIQRRRDSLPYFHLAQHLITVARIKTV